ncbi:MAG: GMC family oxidoreductase [Myxococcales bacterium]|nr:GMC family oxidoreductase [Myxococcales bacterium]
MIHDALHLPDETLLRADVCVIGAGPGGMMVAMVAAEAGLSVVVVEAGSFVTPEDMTQREATMLPLLYWEGAARANVDRSLRVHQGRGVGGSSLHNLNLCKRIPDAMLARWQRDRHLEHLPVAAWHRLYAEVEALLAVSDVPPERWNRHNRLLEAGCRALGWKSAGLRHNRSGCIGSGFCALGCAYDAKNNAAKVLLPRAVRAGADVITHLQAVRIEHDGRRAGAVLARAVSPENGTPLHRIRIDARRVVLAASATATAALLLRSRVPDLSSSVGTQLFMHPAVIAAAEFDEPVEAWSGIPQTVECTEFLALDGEERAPEPEAGAKDRRTWIVPAFGHPAGAAVMLPGHGAPHRAVMKRYNHLAVLTAMLHERTPGRVQPDGDMGLQIDAWPGPADRAELLRGLASCAQLLLAAGARRAWLPFRTPIEVRTHADIVAAMPADFAPHELGLSAVHPMAGVPMSDDPRLGAVDSRGRHHHLSGLWVADGSLLPTSTGVPPQLSIYALGLHVGRAVAAT